MLVAVTVAADCVEVGERVTVVGWGVFVTVTLEGFGAVVTVIVLAVPVQARGTTAKIARMDTHFIRTVHYPSAVAVA